MKISVIIPTHNPDKTRLTRTLLGLVGQTLPTTEWETLIIDNASQPALSPDNFEHSVPQNLRIISEPKLGLTAARVRGFQSARGELCVLVDDDNVLGKTYLESALTYLDAMPKIGAVGGKSEPEFSESPEPWIREFHDLLALRDLGAEVLISGDEKDQQSGRRRYPTCAPIGAGMVLRRAMALQWVKETSGQSPTDRRGDALTSGGDNDLVFSILKQGAQVGYLPDLKLTHLIPTARLQADYLARLNRGIQQSWIQVLYRHDANPWPPISRWTVPFRSLRSWVRIRAWSSPAARIRWFGTRGHFEGRVRATALS